MQNDEDTPATYLANTLEDTWTGVHHLCANFAPLVNQLRTSCSRIMHQVGTRWAPGGHQVGTSWLLGGH